MSTETKKRILISEELVESPVGAFFQTIGLQLDTEYDPKNLYEYSFIVNDYQPDVLSVPRLKLDPKIIYAEDVEKQVRALMTQKNIEDPNVQLLLKSFVSNDCFDLIETYLKEFKTVTSINIHDYLNVGYFIDKMVVDAYRNGFNYDDIRWHLNQKFEYAFKSIEGKKVSPVLEVIYSFSDNIFAVEVSFEKVGFKLDSDFLGNENLLSGFVLRNNYFHLNYFTKRDRLTLTSLWFKNASLKNFKSFFLVETSQKLKSTSIDKPVELGLEQKDHTHYLPREIDEEAIQARKLSMSRKFALFIKNYRKVEQNPKDLMSLDLDDIDRYLKRYPRQEALEDLTDEVKSFILKLLQDEKLFAGITDYVQIIASSNLNPQMEKIKRLLSGKSLADMEEIIRIGGVTANFRDEINTVTGTSEEEGDVIRISEVTNKIGTEDKWIVKRGNTVEKIEEEFVRIKSLGGNVVQDDLIRVVSSELNLETKESTAVVKDIVEEAIAGELTQRNKLGDSVALKIMSQQPGLEAAREKLEGQIVRMKRVMSDMRAEIVKLRTEATSVSSEIDENKIPAVIELKAALNKSLEMLKAKDKMLAKQKLDFENELAFKEDKNKVLKEFLEQMKKDIPKSTGNSSNERLDFLQAENKNLSTRLEIANQKIMNINDNINKHEGDANAKKDKEIITLRTNIQFAQALIEKFKQEKSDLENKLAEEREKGGKGRDDKKGDFSLGGKSEMEKDSLLINLQAEKRSIEDKNRLLAMELKKMEHKLKFSTVQLEELQKRKAPAASTNTKSNEAYIRQLESANTRLNEASADIVEKKKDIIKLKQENGQLMQKLADLEKKLSNLDKKVA